ncbi:MAG: HEAT repeat domain-containing protein [Nitrospinae bacterium]|nr:HEAT repeat domain-containing protein [Nitrospinota bacterium]
MDEIEFHIGRLRAPDFPTRRQSAELLGEFGDPRAVKPLLRMLGDDYWQVRNTVVDALLKIRDRSTIGALLECLRDEDPGVRNTAMSVLNEMREDVAAPLARLLADDPAEDVRIFSANTLGRLKTREAVPGLIEGLKDADENVRYACAEGLGRLGYHDAAMPLLAAMEREDVWARFPYITALGLIGDERACPALIGMLEDEVLSFPAVVALGQIGDIAGLLPLVALLKKTRDPAALRACIAAIACIKKKTEYFSKVERQAFFHDRAAEAVKNIDASHIMETLIEMLHGGNGQEISAALLMLRRTKGNMPVERLFDLLEDETLEEEVRDIIARQGAAALPAVRGALARPGTLNVNQLLRLLGVLGDAWDATAVLPFLESPETEVVCDALKCLGMLEDDAHFDLMTRFLAAPAESVRNAAVGGISLLEKTPAVTRRVFDLLKSEDGLVRRGGYRILGFLSSLQTVNHLMDGLADRAATVRAAAAQSLGYVGVAHRAMLERRECLEALERLTLDEDPAVRIEGALAFARINQPGVHTLLLDMLEETNPAVRDHVIRAVGRCRLKQAGPRLLALLSAEKNPEQKIFLCIALGACGGGEALPLLEEQLDDPAAEVAAEAVLAIAAVGGEAAVDRLLPYLDDPSWIVQDAVICALAGIPVPRCAVAVIRFMERLKNDANRGLLLRAAIRTLGRIGGAAEIETVLGFLGDETCQYEAFGAVWRIVQRTGFGIRPRDLASPAARRLACTAAAVSPAAETAAELALMLEDPYPSVRRAASLALQVRNDIGAAARARQRCANDGDFWMRETAKTIH